MGKDIRLCLDFGTSYSKAWATKGASGDEIPIPLGEAAGGHGVEHTWTVASEIWRENDRLYWGSEAERRRQEAQASEPTPMKEYITSAKKVRSLDEASKRTGLSGEETLTLWLAYMLRLCEQYLDDRQGWAIPLRVGMPCLGGSHENVARQALANALEGAATISRNYRGDWDGVSLRTAKEVARRGMKDGRRAVKRGTTRNQEPKVVREPIAAGGGVFEDVVSEWSGGWSNDPELIRRLLLVMDAGAGTTDFTLMQTFDRRGELRLGVIPGAQTGVRIGGRKLREGVEEVLRRNWMSAATTDAEVEEEAERTMRRIWLGDNEAIEDAETRKQVEATERHRKAMTRLKKARTACLTKALSQDDVQHHGTVRNQSGERWPIWTVATGGGAEMDVVRQLVRGRIRIGSAVFEFQPLGESDSRRGGGAAQRGLRRIERRQMAVAKGGAMPRLPEEVGDLGRIVMP